MTALADALTAAGFQTPMDRLRQEAKDAIRSSPRNWDGAKDALYGKIRNDAGLLWELFAPYRSQAVQLLLTQAAAEVREEERPYVVARDGVGGGRKPEADGERGVGHTKNDTHGPSARPSRSHGMDAVASVARLTLLDTFRVNGRAIGDLTPEEANAWAGSRERDARFVRLLTANLPPGHIIREFRTGDEATQLYAQAEVSGA